MRVDVTIDGRPWLVTIESGERAGLFAVTVNGRRREIDVTRVDADTLSIIDGGAVRDVRLHRRGARGSFGVEIGGRVYDAVLSTGGERSRPRAEDGSADAAAADATHAVMAPMPGRVVRVLVAIGDRVASRQALVVVEAMKMENELRAPHAGIVEEIRAVPGSAVDTGAVLLTLRTRD